MSNMSYCRFENTLADLVDCADALDERVELDGCEAVAKADMIKLCEEIVRKHGEPAPVKKVQNGGPWVPEAVLVQRLEEAPNALPPVWTLSMLDRREVLVPNAGGMTRPEWRKTSPGGFGTKRQILREARDHAGRHDRKVYVEDVK